MYCVYKHTCPNGKVYIGITSRNPLKRWNGGHNYKHNRFFNKAIVKYGWDNIKHEILFDGLTKEDAEQTEIELIALYKSNNREYGYNLTIGGDGSKNGRSVLCIETGVVYPSAVEAEVALGIANHCIYRCCNKRRGFVTAGGYHWIHADEATEDNVKCALMRKGICRRKVLCVELNKVFSAIMEAEKATGISNTNIGACCKGKRKTAGGYHWQYAPEREVCVCQ